MDQGLLTTCSRCGAEVSLETLTRLRDLTCPVCHQAIREVPEVGEPSLVVIHGETPGSVLTLDGETSFGRAPTNTMTLREMKASRQHAVVRRNGSQYIVKDLKSANGTYVNNQLVTSRVLTSGDLVRIADSVFLFRNPRERASVTSKLGARFRDGEYQTEAELKYSEQREMLTLAGQGEHDVGKLQKANEKLRIIYDVTSFISAILDLEVLLDKILDVVFDHIPAERGAIFLVEDDGELIQRVVKKRGAEVEDRYMEVSTTIINKVINDLTAVLTTDALQDESFSHAHSIISQGIRQAMTVPLIAREQLLGLVHIDTTRMSRAFNQDNLQLLTGIAGQAAIAIQNAKLIDKIEAEVKTRSALARYLAPELVEQVVNKQLDLEMGGQIKKVTLMFSDLRGFTSMAERISAVDVVETLNSYFEVMVDTIFQHGGMLDKFIGDAIMAVWGLPLEKPTDALDAVRAAIEMQVQLYLFNYQLRRESREPFEMGIGINTGDVVNGNMGSPKRSEYTVIGSAVNLASRIEALTKRHQTLISENTFREVRKHVRAIELEPTTVKGISGLIKVYCVMGVARDDLSGQPSPHDVDVFFPVNLMPTAGGDPVDGVMVLTSNTADQGITVDVLLDGAVGELAGNFLIDVDVYGIRTLEAIPGEVVHSGYFAPRNGLNLTRARLALGEVMDLSDEVAGFFDEYLFPRGD